MKTCPHCGGELPADKGREKGGKERWKGVSKARRSEIARKAAAARWQKKRPAQSEGAKE
jgi:hypothetical protein